MSNENIVLPLDLRKSIPTNKVEDEEHYVSVNRKILVAKHGFFYTDTFKIKLKDSSDYLTLDEDFKFGTIDQDLTLKTGSKVTSYITFLKYDLTPNIFEIECHYVGGERSASTTKLTHLIEDLKNRQKPVDFKQIKGKPTAYRPKPDHLHHVNDLYGLEYVIKPLELLKNGLNIGDEFIHKEIRDLIDNVQDFIDTHSNSTNNPHDEDKSSIGLSLLMNYPFADLEDLINRVPDKYIGPQGVKYLIDEEAKGPLESHFNDINNPHELTKHQIELGNVENFGIANLPVSIAGVSNEHYITPNGFSHLLNDLVGPSLNNHIFDIDDPHELTKHQIDLGNVENFGIATRLEAEEGVSNERYMTPLRTKELCNHFLRYNPFNVKVFIPYTEVTSSFRWVYRNGPVRSAGSVWQGRIETTVLPLYVSIMELSGLFDIQFGQYTGSNATYGLYLYDINTKAIISTIVQRQGWWGTTTNNGVSISLVPRSGTSTHFRNTRIRWQGTYNHSMPVGMNVGVCFQLTLKDPNSDRLGHTFNISVS